MQMRERKKHIMPPGMNTAISSLIPMFRLSIIDFIMIHAVQQLKTMQYFLLNEKEASKFKWYIEYYLLISTNKWPAINFQQL